MPGDGLLTQGEINSNGQGVQLQANVSHSELLNGGFVTLTVTIGNGQPQEYELELVNGILQFTNGDAATGFTYNNGVITWTEDAPAAGESITVTATQTDLAGNESAEASDTAQVFEPGHHEISINESDLRDDVPNVVSQQISFTAGNEALTQFRFGNVNSIQAATNLATGVSIVWTLVSGSLVGSVGGVDIIKLTLSGTDSISANSTGSITVNIELLDNIKQVNGLAELNLSSLIEGIVIEAVGENNSVISANLDLIINDDLIDASATNSNGLNAANTLITGSVVVAGADGNDNVPGDELTGDQYSADLSVNIAGWSDSSTFADSGLLTSGQPIYYYVDPDDTSVLIAYTSTSPAEWGANGVTQIKVFTLTLDPNTGEYVLDLDTPITKITTTDANLQGAIPGGNDEDLFVLLNGTVKGEIDINDVVLCTITATDANGVSTVNTSPNGIGVGTGKDIGAGESLSLEFAFPVAHLTELSLSYNNGSTYSGVFTITVVGKDALGNDLTETFVATSATLASLIADKGFAEFSKIELSKAAGGDDFNLQSFTANSFSVDPLGTTLNFNVAITDSDGDTESNNPFSVTLTVPNALSAVTPAAFASLDEAKLVSDTMDADNDTLVFKAGDSDVNNVNFSTDLSGIQVEGIRQPMSWRIEDGILIGSMPGRGDLLKLTLDWDAIEAGHQGSVVVEAELLGKLPHNVDYNSLSITGIKVVATDTSGQIAKADVTVTVADSKHIAVDDTNHVDVLIDSFEVREVTAKWIDWTAESGYSDVRTYDGNDDDTAHDIIRWGNVWPNNPRSGYNFDENTNIQVGDVGLNQNIILGTFTHVNHPINGDSSITNATLEVTLMINGVPAKITLEFNHNETGGDGNPPDIVTVANTYSEFVYDGARYTLLVMGFLDSNGNVVTSIKTAEGASTSFPLVVQLIPGDGFELPTIGGNVLSNDIQGADGDMEINALSHNGSNASESHGTFVVQGTYGTLTLYSDGSYSYQVTTVGSLIPDNAVDTFNYTIEDSDGDLSTAELNINLNAVEVLPIMYEGAQGVDSFLLNNGGTTGKGQFATSLGGYGAVAPETSVDIISLDTALHIKAGDSNDYVDLGISTADNTVETGSSLPNVSNQLSQQEVLSSKFMSDDTIVRGDHLKQNVLNEIQPKTDTVNLGQGDDAVYGGEGSQMIYGGAGNDLLMGEGGIDGLRGGDGNDTLIGGLGDDVLRGDSGADKFVWRYADADNGTDHIMDFNANQDKLDLSDLLQGETANTLENYLNFSLDNGSTVIDIDANKDGVFEQHIVLDGVDLYSQYGAIDNAGIINGLLGSNGNGPLIIDAAPVTPDAPQGLTQPLDPNNNNGTMIP
ncbi:type I secretion C-terminal target domain-containing protein [Shewanella sp.]|uniref:type I secretion C-terminal target domain-containing protein n=1 Tax=Shewanella sp. TaxID=50422 RepID=UPI002619BCBE|nr:type I secretion C-terminal target domain-containing protein [Shewanella sp.]